jgi:hypothetical protein
VSVVESLQASQTGTAALTRSVTGGAVARFLAMPKSSAGAEKA